MTAFERQEERKRKLKELYEKYKFEALLKLASDLRIDAETLLRIMSGSQGIDVEIGKHIDWLWQVIFGKVKVEVPKADLREALISVQETEISALEEENRKLKDKIASLEKALKEKPEPEIKKEKEKEPEFVPEEEFEPEPEPIEPEKKPEFVPEFEFVEECPMMVYADDMVGKTDKYLSPEHRDYLINQIQNSEYDGALGRVRSQINRKIEEFFGNHLTINETPGLSHDESECRDARTYEFVIYDADNAEVYQLKYAKGQTIYSTPGSFSNIVPGIEFILRVEGKWEK